MRGAKGGSIVLLLAGLGASLALAGPPSANNPPPGLAQVGLPSPAEARAIIERFRDAGVAGGGTCFLEFQLQEMPHRGDERVVPGRLWAARDELGPVVRIAVDDPRQGESRFLVQGGPQPSIWRWDAKNGLRTCDPLDPLADGSNIAAFDLQMPFLYWPDARVVSVNRVLGRPANGFVFRPPPAFAAAHPDILAVQAYLDAEYNAPVEVQIVGRDGGVRKTLSLVDLKKVRGRWIVKEADVRDELTRNKTRFFVTAAALGLDLSPALFGPAALPENVAPPASLERFDW